MMVGRSLASLSSDTSGRKLHHSPRRNAFRCALLLVAFCSLFCRPPNPVRGDAGLPPIRGTFLQLLSHHQDWKVEDWQRLFAEFNALRISKLVVQWSVSADLAFYPSETLPHGANPPLETILDLADKGGMVVQLGLWHDPGYWENIAASSDLLEIYLRRARLRSSTIADELLPLIRRHRSFQGWYISEEIDDSSWNEPARRKMLLEHLAGLSVDLRQTLPNANVGISCFSNARLDPKSCEEFWEALLAGSSIDTLYFQDGIGAHKLELDYLPLYLDAAKRATEPIGRTLAVVVEMFEQKQEAGTATAEFQAVPAPLSRIDRQIELATRYAGEEIVAFSIPDYMTGAAGTEPRRLLESYMRKYFGTEPRASID